MTDPWGATAGACTCTWDEEGDRIPCSSHRAEYAEERRAGICRTCLAPIWNEGGTIGHQHRDTGWSDRVERGGDSLVCFRAVEYRHVPLKGREAHIYDRAYVRGQESK